MKNKYKPKLIKKTKIALHVGNVTKQQLETLKAELALLTGPWKRQGVRILVGRKVA
tara:strand:+ start:395 stop:562 length:168 start_codon:yes stop_codon:yes gene_type:complete